MNEEKRIYEKYEKLRKNMKNMKNCCFLKKMLHRIHDGNVVHNIIIYNIISHNFQFLSCFLDITHIVGNYE